MVLNYKTLQETTFNSRQILFPNVKSPCFMTNSKPDINKFKHWKNSQFDYNSINNLVSTFELPSGHEAWAFDIWK
jgi:hypothetical protein